MAKGDNKPRPKKSAPSKYTEKIKVETTFDALLNLTFKDADKKIKARTAAKKNK